VKLAEAAATPTRQRPDEARQTHKFHGEVFYGEEISVTPLVVAAKLPRRQTNEHTNRRASLLRKASLRGGERGLTSLSQFKINTNVRIGSDAACGWVSIRHS